MLNIAVIGVGYLGTFYCEKLIKSKKVTLSAIVDNESDTARTASKKFKVPAFLDYHDLKNLNINCACIVSSTSSHYEIAKWCLENGIDILLEKPMTATLEEAREILNIATKNNRILQVGHLERFNPVFRAVKDILSKPVFFEARRIAEFKPRGTDVDVVLDLMIHDIDIISHLVNKNVEKIEAIGTPVLTNSIDIANARITFEGGAIANVTASRAAFNTERTIRIFQQDTYISIDYQKKKLKVYKKGEGKDILGYPKIHVTENKVQDGDALQDEIESFINCVANHSTPVVSGEDGLRAMELAEKIRFALSNRNL